MSKGPDMKVLIAEDDLMIADLLEVALIRGDYKVCGIARTVSQAVQIAEVENPDLAVIDVHLAEGGIGTEIPTLLDRRGTLGILYATGNAGDVELTSSDGHACISKPYRPSDIVRALKIVEQIMKFGTASQPFPRGCYALGV
jgi:ActR/RegA family two-component response regulator